MTTVRTAVLQFESIAGRVRENIDQSLIYLEKAASQGVKIAVLPELCQSGYDLSPQLAAQVAEPIEGESVRRWADFARTHQMYVIAGLCESANGLIYNSAVLIGPEGYIGTYRKAHLFFHEKDVFAPGDTGFPVFDLEWGKLSMLICYDLRFPEALRVIALKGAELICVPTAWVTPTGKQWDDHGYSMQAYCAMAHASMNRMYIACADTYGAYRDTQYLGGSLIASPLGWSVAGPAPIDESAVLVADLDLMQARVKSHNPNNDLFKDRRTDLYGEYPR